MGAKPVYMEYDNSIREMSFQDVMDTFIDPVVDKIQLSSTDARALEHFLLVPLHHIPIVQT